MRKLSLCVIGLLLVSTTCGCAMLPAGLKKYDKVEFDPGVNIATENSLEAAQAAGAEALANRPGLSEVDESEINAAHGKTSAGIAGVNSAADAARKTVSDQTNAYNQAAANQAQPSDLQDYESQYNGTLEQYSAKNDSNRAVYQQASSDLESKGQSVEQQAGGVIDKMKENDSKNFDDIYQEKVKPMTKTDNGLLGTSPETAEQQNSGTIANSGAAQKSASSGSAEQQDLGQDLNGQERGFHFAVPAPDLKTIGMNQSNTTDIAGALGE